MGETASEKGDLQKKVIQQLLMEYRNPQGALYLIRENRYSGEEIDRLINEVLEEASKRGVLHKRQFDISSMRYLSYEEWLKKYFIKMRNKLAS